MELCRYPKCRSYLIAVPKLKIHEPYVAWSLIIFCSVIIIWTFTLLNRAAF